MKVNRLPLLTISWDLLGVQKLPDWVLDWEVAMNGILQEQMEYWKPRETFLCVVVEACIG
jgi:hypothetical protein